MDCVDHCSWFFSQCFLVNAKNYFLRANEAILRAKDAAAYERCVAAPDCAALLRATAAFACASGTWEDTQRVIDPLPFAARIATPCGSRGLSEGRRRRRRANAR